MESVEKTIIKNCTKNSTQFLKKLKKRERFLSKSKDWTTLVTIALRLIDNDDAPSRAGGGQKQVFDADQEGLTNPCY